jgi:hypothetical protein
VKAGLIVAGVLSAGTAVVFGAAAVTATLFPSGATVAGRPNEAWQRLGWAPDGGRILPGLRGGPVMLGAPDAISVDRGTFIEPGGVVDVVGIAEPEIVFDPAPPRGLKD